MSTPGCRIGWNGKNQKIEHILSKRDMTIYVLNKELTDKWPRKLVWETKLPPKVVGFIWTTLYEACLTQDDLNKICYMCQMESESVRHLFMHCVVAADIWNTFLSTLYLPGSCQTTLKMLMRAGHGEFGNPSKKNLVYSAWFYFLVHLEERNSRCFLWDFNS